MLDNGRLVLGRGGDCDARLPVVVLATGLGTMAACRLAIGRALDRSEPQWPASADGMPLPT